MIVDRTARRGSSTASTLGIIARGTAVALVVSVAVVVVSQLLGHPAHPGLAATMAVVAASWCAAGQKKRPGRKSRMG